MSLSNKDVNNLLLYSKEMIESLDNKADDYIRKNMMILSYAAMICYYGIDNIEAIHNAFNTKMLVGSSKVIMSLLEKRNSLDEVLKQRLISGQISGFCDFKCDYVTKNNSNFYTVDPYICIVDYGILNYVDLTEVIVHEINHIVNAYNKNIIIKDSNYYLRVGLLLTNLNEDWSKNVSIEEGINVLQTADIMNIIRKFTKYDVKDADLDAILKHIKHFHKKKSTGSGYEMIVDCVRDLYNDVDFEKISTYARITGNIESIIDYFNSRTYKGGFDELSDKLDIYQNSYDSGEKQKIWKLINKYLDK